MTAREHNESQAGVPLSSIAAGKQVRVVRCDGGARMQHRLAEMGLSVGTLFRVVTGGRGPVVISIRGGRLAIGRGMTGKIFVRDVAAKEHKK